MPLLGSDPRASEMQYTRSQNPETYPVVPRPHLRDARNNALRITTSLLAVEFLIDGRFKTHTSISTALTAIRRILRGEHGGVLPDVLLDEWLRKGQPYAAGTRSKFLKDPLTGRQLSYVELGRCVDAWADWGRVKREFWFVFEREQEGVVKEGEGPRINFAKIGTITKDEFTELERQMWVWIADKEKAKAQQLKCPAGSGPVPDVEVDAPTVSGLFSDVDAHPPRGTILQVHTRQPPPQRIPRGNWMEVVLNQDHSQGEWESTDDDGSSGNGNGNSNGHSSESDTESLDKRE